MLKESLLYEKLTNLVVRCKICQRFCQIKDGEMGFCKTRINQGGKLFSVIYGEVSYWRKAPIEIKPVYHFLPGSYAFSLGSLGCNFLCPGCQNWDISQMPQLTGKIEGQDIIPEEIVKTAREHMASYILHKYLELKGDQKIFFYNLLEEYFPHLLSKYKKLYGDNYIPNKKYILELNSKMDKYCKKYEISNKI